MKSSTKMIALVALVCAAPFISAWVAYYFIQPQGGQSYGTLLPTVPIVSATDRAQTEGADLTGKWLLIQQEIDDCSTQCRETLYATRQGRTMQGRERERVVRVLVVKGQIPTDLAAEHPDLVVRERARMPHLPELVDAKVFLVDPLGNQVISWPKNPDIKRLNQDLSRLLRASRIG